jgi:alkanesulfonate monooxygenase SsuD/methylene tetrahydromethanopterin reductase-like flavin-dependent oxidoreductase (luciferase family)
MLTRVVAIGVQTWGTDVDALERYWRRADALGYARITYGDGLWGFTHDGWTMLGALAGVTERARLGHAVTYAFDTAAHHPAWLAKRAVALDHLSRGRFDLRLGVGAGDAETRACWERHGIAYPRAAERVARLDEAVALVRRLWSGEPVEAAGRFGRLDGARLAPAPVQRPGPPVWIAAMGPRALEVVARRADGWEASFLAPPALARRRAAVARLLEREGRAAGSLGVSVEVDAVVVERPADTARALRGYCAARGIGGDHPLVAAALVGDPATLAARVEAYAAAGATDLMVGFADFPATAMLERFAREVLPALRAAGSQRRGAP